MKACFASPQSRQAGLSLIDLMIVLAIVSITAGIGLPSLRPLLYESQAHHYVKSLSTDLAYMRHYAISYGQAVTICPLKGGRCINDWHQHVAIFVDEDRNRKKGSREKLLKLIDDPKPGDYFSYPHIGITYRSDGSINGFQSGTFRYCPAQKDSQFSVALVVNQAGRTRFVEHGVKCKSKG